MRRDYDFDDDEKYAKSWCYPVIPDETGAILRVECRCPFCNHYNEQPRFLRKENYDRSIEYGSFSISRDCAQCDQMFFAICDKDNFYD